MHVRRVDSCAQPPHFRKTHCAPCRQRRRRVSAKTAHLRPDVYALQVQPWIDPICLSWCDSRGNEMRKLQKKDQGAFLSSENRLACRMCSVCVWQRPGLFLFVGLTSISERVGSRDSFWGGDGGVHLRGLRGGEHDQGERPDSVSELLSSIFPEVDGLARRRVATRCACSEKTCRRGTLCYMSLLVLSSDARRVAAESCTCSGACACSSHRLFLGTK